MGTVYNCPRDGEELEGTMLDHMLWCPLEGAYIPDSELEE